MSRWPAKDPDEVADYAIEWAAKLVSDTIVSSTWTVPTGITKDSDTNTATMAKIWLSGGVDGKTYRIHNRIVTAGGRTFEKTMRLAIKTK